MPAINNVLDNDISIKDVAPESVFTIVLNTGAQGIQGVQGIQGPVGPQGVQGIQGPQGDKGDKGDKGDAAFSLVVGETTTGAAGTQANVENVGTASDLILNFTIPKGDKGETGSQGIQGPKGDTGEKGDKGDKGDTGSQGPKGDTGNTGPQGPQGNTGAKGDKGDTGSTGPQGPTGATGAAGQDGFSPIANVSKSGSTATISITDRIGTTTAEITDGTNGEDGEDGVSPTVSTSKVGKTTTITITDRDGVHTATILDGQDGQGSGDMNTSVYDVNRNGIVDNAEKVNNHTVGIDVPSNALFTDTTYTAGTNVSISDSNVISATDTTYSAGANISIDANNEISATDTTYTAGIGIDITNGVISNTQTSAEWGNITGTLSNQSDLNTALGGKASSSSVTAIEEKIPQQATSSNQLADKNFVNSSINSVTAYYITKNAAGDQFATKAELNAATTFYSGGEVRIPTRNDYCIVLTDETKTDATTGEKPTTRYIYQNNSWEFQYIVNKTSLTAAQLAAVNSGITSSSVAQIGTNASNITSLQSGKEDTSNKSSSYTTSSTTTYANTKALVDGLATKQNTLTTQTAYTNKGSSTRVPQITTNNLGQVTNITEKTITQPTVNNATLTIKRNNTSVGTFTANASSNKDINITVPTKTSDLTNDSNFITTSIYTMLGLSTNSWSSSRTYAINDVESYNYKLYRNKTGNNTSTNPSQDTTNWEETSLLV